MYKNHTSFSGQAFVIRIADNAFIPFDPANTDYAEYLKWLAEGNTPLPSDSAADSVTDEPVTATTPSE